MKYGLYEQGYVRRGADPLERVRQVVAEAQAAEWYGLEFFGVSEQHFKFPTNSTGAIDTVLSWVAATTENLRLMPSAVIPALAHPLAVAERWATIDVLSGGRLDFAVGRGNTPKTADAFQIPIPETNARTMESLAIIMKAWSGEEFSHRGEFWQFDNLRVHPRPIQSPVPRVSLAAISVGACQLAGGNRIGLVATSNNVRWSQVHDRIGAYRAAWETGEVFPGAAPSSNVNLQVPIHVAKTSQLAREQVEFGIVEYCNRVMKQDLLNHRLTYGTEKGMDTTGEFYDNFQGLLDLTPLAVGSPQYCIEKLVRVHEEFNVDEITLHVDYASHEDLLECIRLIGEEVLPEVKRLTNKSVSMRYNSTGAATTTIDS
ncbi:LLM class flavin-dependent oxidoreductase [Tsukamurella soli]|uniref:LLM class flavin-dependent oxidoreductase n=1 Tax=Tsukamurella soli TaxID=644556 RepID=A0ABP8K8L2_9ACTN